jgi:hypothetical protein
VGGAGVVVFLAGFGVDGGSDGDGVLGAAGRRVGWRVENLGVVEAECERVGFERAAQFAGRCRAGDAVVAVGVVGGLASEFVAGQFGAGGVVDVGGVGASAALEGGEVEQGGRGGRAVERSVAADGTLVGAFGSAVVGVEVLDEGGAELRSGAA